MWSTWKPTCSTTPKRYAPALCLTQGQVILEAFDNHREERIIANTIKKEFDKQYGKCSSRSNGDCA